MSTKYALLGLLNIKKMSAYDLSKFAKESIGYFWNESYSNVHKSLNVLKNDKLIEKLPEKGSRNKTIYEITPLGQSELSKWLANNEYSIIYRDELLLKLFVSTEKNYPFVLENLKKYLDELYQQEEIYSKLQEFVASKKNNFSYQLVLDYGIIQNKTTIEWLEKTIKRIEEIL